MTLGEAIAYMHWYTQRSCYIRRAIYAQLCPDCLTAWKLGVRL